ncbi:kelch domain-containing protein 1-like [Halichondria panicea]|uniref:kelch domain-containing protein 1-like n=1 Tax=Halichondria panicea TaxID=6063 RepID=UPI00312B5DB9
MERVVPITVPTEEIDQRNGGCGVIFENKLYVWGGNTTDVHILKPVEDSDSSSNSDNDDSDKEDIDVNLPVPVPVSLPRSNDENHPFDVLDLTTNKWFRQSTSGEYPTLGLGSSLSVHHPSRTIILFSGFKDLQFDNEVYKVSPDREWVWEKVEVMPEVKPRERYQTGVIIHKDRMCVFGGVGRASREIGNPPKPQDLGARYLAYVEDEIERDYGWTSEYLEFDINTSEWEAPLDENAFRPDPLGSHAFSKFDSHRAVLFGGNGSALVYSNTCYIFDFDSREWSGPYKPDDPEEPWPIATRFSTLTSLVDPENVWQEMCGQIVQPRMVLLWGKSSKLHISPETWLLEFNFDNPNPLVWKKLKIGVEPRSWHIAKAVYSNKTTSCELVIFGGNVYKYPITDMFQRENVANLTILHFGGP